MADPANNAMGPDMAEPAFDTPLVGFCAGDDPVFETIRNHIGDFYWTPAMAFAMAFPDAAFSSSDLTLIAWVLPQTAATRADHRKATDLPSARWSRVRHYGEQGNMALRRHVETFLGGAGVPASAPMLLPAWRRADSPDYGYASTWSERHAAFACGLGTFGLSDGLITPKGKAVRVGSAVARLRAPSTPRPYADHRAHCLFFSRGACRGCRERCPAGAITEKGHDKVKCSQYIRQVTAPFVETEQLGFRVDSCGLCQVGVPCEFRIPDRDMPA